jgi:hypothetical protein
MAPPLAGPGGLQFCLLVMQEPLSIIFLTDSLRTLLILPLIYFTHELKILNSAYLSIHLSMQVLAQEIF